MKSSYRRRAMFGAFAAILIGAGLTPATLARAAVQVAPPMSITQVEPANAAVSGQLWIERVAPTSSSAAPTWRVNVDMIARNTSTSKNITITTVTTSFPGSGISSSTGTINKTLTPGAGLLLIVPESRRFAFPIATNIRFQINVSGYDPVFINRTLKEYVNKTPSGGYRFPAGRVSGGYWENLIGHENGPGHNTHHRGAQNQRFAYDLVVDKWNGSKYTDLKPGEDGKQNTDYWTFGTPIYAMADGVVVKCRRDQVDNVPGVPNPSPEVEGNHLYIRHATGEVALYAHFKANGLSAAICPTNINPNVPVVKGQLLGYSGNTGNSYGPHLHLHLANKEGFGTSAAPAQGLPLRFDHALTRTKSGLTPTTSISTFAVLNNTHEGALADQAMIQPNRCGWQRVVPGLAEWARHGVNSSCWQEEFDDIALANYRLIWRQQFQSGATSYVASIWRPRAGLAWASRSGLTGAQYQSVFNSYTGAGYRLTHVDSYLVNGAVTYSAVFTKTTGPAWVAYHGLSQATHQSRFNTLTSQGYRPTEISVVYVGGARQFTAFYQKVNVGSFYANQTIAESSYQIVFNQQASAGRRLVYLDVYPEGSINRFSAIFTSAASTNYKARHGLTSAQYQAEYNSARAAGLLTRAVCGYVSAGIKYAALWRA